MKNKALVPGLLIVFLLLLGFSAWQTEQQNNAPANTNQNDANPANFEIGEPVFENIAIDDITSVSALDPLTGLSLTFVRTDEGWDMAELALPVDPRQAEAVARTIAELPYLQTIDDIEPAQYTDYGLEDRRIFLLFSLILEDNTQHAVIVGDVAPGNTGHYALVDEREEIYVVDARPIAFITAMLRQLYENVTDSDE